jgi:hypothetical protein
MKLKISNSSIDQIIPYSKIFQTLKVPERTKKLLSLQRNVASLNNDVKLLDIIDSKRKAKKDKKKVNIIRPKTKATNLKETEQKKVVKFSSFDNCSPQNKSNSNFDSISSSSYRKQENILYMDKFSSLKKKNQLLTEKMIKKSEKNNKVAFHDNIFNTNKSSELFVTEFNLPNIKSMDIKHGNLRKVNTESNNYYENTINDIKKSQKNSDIFNNNLKNIILTNNSETNILPPILIKKRQILDLCQSEIDKNKNDQKASTLNDSMENLENNSLDSNMNIGQYNNEDSVNERKYNTIEASRNKSNIKKISSKFNSQLIKLFGNISQGTSNSPPQIKNIIKDVKKLNNNFKKQVYNYDLENWIMRSKFRYAQWRYGIADIEKYFIDLNDFGKKEENELDNRKSFYEKAELVIKELKDDKDKKEIMDDTEKYGIKLNHKKNKKKVKENEYWEDEQKINKMMEMNKALKLTEKRKVKEKKNWNKLEELMFQCKKGVYNINNS